MFINPELPEWLWSQRTYPNEVCPSCGCGIIGELCDDCEREYQIWLEQHNANATCCRLLEHFKKRDR
jgi:hypothetical protein